MPKVSDLSLNHYIRLYLFQRAIKDHSIFYYANKFKEFANNICGYIKFLGKQDSPRIIIPLIDEHNRVFGFQGRAIEDSTLGKYVTIMLDDTKPKLYGLDRIDNNKRMYITEGPFVLYFLITRCMCGADLYL